MKQIIYQFIIDIYNILNLLALVAKGTKTDLEHVRSDTTAYGRERVENWWMMDVDICGSSKKAAYLKKISVWLVTREVTNGKKDIWRSIHKIRTTFVINSRVANCLKMLKFESGSSTRGRLDTHLVGLNMF